MPFSGNFEGARRSCIGSRWADVTCAPGLTHCVCQGFQIITTRPQRIRIRLEPYDFPSPRSGETLAMSLA